MTESTTPTVRVVIIGAGAGGLGLAILLDRAGIDDFLVFEKADGLGGTWRVNTYPGAECDVPSHLYSYSFALNPEWSKTFAGQRGDPAVPRGLRGRLSRWATGCIRHRGDVDHVVGRSIAVARDHRRRPSRCGPRWW